MTKFYMTTPLYYANSRPHVGSAYTTLVCDAIARYRRMLGEDVAFLTGTDEHGENIERAAAKQGVTPAQLVDRNRQVFLDLWKHLGISYTHFIRTTEPAHVRTVQTLLLRAQERGFVYKGRYQGRYCVFDNLYVSDSTEPIDCPTCGRPAELMAEENYFFKLSAFQDRLLELYEKHPEFVQPDFRRNEVVSFVSAGLKDISISRRAIRWGVPWPGDPEHVFYVWYDALSGYLTGIGFADSDGKNGQFGRYWPANLHMIGKEIIRFHAVYWPAFLLAAEMPIPQTVFAHGWLLFEQQKMSKSKGNVAYCEPIANVVGADALRYYLLRDVVFGQDGNFSREALLTRYNSDLANDLGNLVSRTVAMIARYFGGEVPPAAANGDLEADLELLASETIANFRDGFNRFAFSRAIETVWELVARTNQYLVETAPWAMAEDPAQRDRLASVLYAAAEGVRLLAALLAPVIPDAAEKIWRQLGLEGSAGSTRLDRLEWGGLVPGTRVAPPEAVFPRVDKKQALERIEAMENEIRHPAPSEAPTSESEAAHATEPQPVLPRRRIQIRAPESEAPPATAPERPLRKIRVTLPGTASSQSEPAAVPSAPAAGPTQSARISIEEFAKVEMRVGQVKSAERVANADRLLKLLVDIGTENRQVVAGIAAAYQPEQLVGRKVVIVTNLEPRKLRGVESNGMIVAATRPDGSPVLCSFVEDVPVGARLK